MIAPFVLNKQVCYMKKRIQFGKEKKQIDYDLIRTVGIWAFKIILICLLALVIVFYFGRQVKIQEIPCVRQCWTGISFW